MFVSFRGKNNEILTGEVIQSEPRLERLVSRMSKVDAFAFDTETNTLRVQAVGDLEIVGISICFGKKDNYYIPMGHFFDDNQLPVDLVMDYLRPQFERLDVLVVGHNLKFDMHVMACYKVNIRTKYLWDTMIASWSIDENEEKGLKHLTNLVFDVPQEKFDACLATITKEERKAYGLKGNKKPPFLLVRIPVGAPYAIADAYWTWRHYCDWQLDMVEQEEVEAIYTKKMIPFLKTLFSMERRGVRINKERLQKMSVMADKDLAKLQYAILEISGVEFNIGSNQQLGEILFGYKKVNKKGEFSGNIHLIENNFGFPIKSTTDSGAPATGEGALQALIKLDYKKDKRKKEGQKMLKLILKYKRLAKLKSAFIDGLLLQVYPDGRIHPTFNLGGASSGRLSCSEPNLQQLPRPIEMEDCKSFSDWAKEHNIIFTLKERRMFKYLSKCEKGFYTGEIDPSQKPTKNVNKYLEYLKEWREKNEDNLMWKYYEIRDAIMSDSDNDKLIALDYSNLEMRLLAHFSQDPKLLETFIQDHDSHGATAVNMFSLDCSPDEAKKLYKSLRQIAKTINFMLMYGGGASTLYNTLSDEGALDENGEPITKEKAQEYYDMYFQTYDGVKDFIKNQHKYAHKFEMIYTLIGRKRRLPEINKGNMRMVSYLERLSVNACIQGSGADVMIMVQPVVEANKRLKELNCTMRLQVHDELVFNCPEENVEEAISIIKDIMEHPFKTPLNVPLRADADSGATYAEAK